MRTEKIIETYLGFYNLKPDYTLTELAYLFDLEEFRNFHKINYHFEEHGTATILFDENHTVISFKADHDAI